ncbi:MAG: hypothetical protein IK000_08400 [Bacteroidaceae bacterium]|nr:hypothetical protein [Bacteroidaceae bacterium]
MSDFASSCPHCGFPLDQMKKDASRATFGENEKSLYSDKVFYKMAFIKGYLADVYGPLIDICREYPGMIVTKNLVRNTKSQLPYIICEKDNYRVSLYLQNNQKYCFDNSYGTGQWNLCFSAAPINYQSDFNKLSSLADDVFKSLGDYLETRKGKFNGVDYDPGLFKVFDATVEEPEEIKQYISSRAAKHAEEIGLPQRKEPIGLIKPDSLFENDTDVSTRIKQIIESVVDEIKQFVSPLTAKLFGDDTDKSTIIKKFVWLLASIILLTVGIGKVSDLISNSSSSSSDKSFVGTYFYTDAVNHDYIFRAKSNGDAYIIMTSAPNSDLDEIAYSDVRKGVLGYWKRCSYLRGNNKYVPYVDAYFGGDNIMFCEGFVYFDYTSMKERRGGIPYRKR